MNHKVTDEFIIKLEEKLHLASLKSDKISKRVVEILAAMEGVVPKGSLENMKDTSSKKHLSWWARFKLFLAHLFNK